MCVRDHVRMLSLIVRSKRVCLPSQNPVTHRCTATGADPHTLLGKGCVVLARKGVGQMSTEQEGVGGSCCRSATSRIATTTRRLLARPLALLATASSHRLLHPSHARLVAPPHLLHSSRPFRSRSSNGSRMKQKDRTGIVGMISTGRFCSRHRLAQSQRADISYIWPSSARTGQATWHPSSRERGHLLPQTSHPSSPQEQPL